MRYLRTGRWSKSKVFILLMVISLVSLLLPRDLFGWVRALVRPITFMQLGAREPTQLIAERVQSVTSGTVPAEQYQEEVRRREALENEIVSLRQSLAYVQQMNEALKGIREHGFPVSGRLIPAKVAGFDPVPGRASIQLPHGRRQGARPGDWVVSRRLVHAGTAQGASERAAVIARESLIGWVESVSTTTSTVVLLSDPTANKALRVRVAGRDGAPIDLVLEGAGRGQMRIPDIQARLVENEDVHVGQLVVSVPDDPSLPVSLVIGQIIELSKNRDKPLYYDARVAHRHDPDSLREVYIVDLSGDAQ